MGRIAKLLSFVRSTIHGAKITNVKIDIGGGELKTAQHFAPVGDDSHPLTTDYVITQVVPRNGGEAVIGYVDPLNTSKSNEGDKRIYARDSDGAVVVEVWLKNDGTGVLSNDNGSITLNPNGSIKGLNSNGSFELQTGGDFVVNGVTIAVDGSVTIPSSLNLNGKEIAEHDHTIASGSSAPGPTGANN